MKGNKSNSTFCDKSGDAVLSATPNLWGNIQIIRTHILKHDVLNPVSLVIRYLNFEILYHCFGYASDDVICHILDNVKNMKKIYFQTQKCVYHGCTLGKMY